MSASSSISGDTKRAVSSTNTGATVAKALRTAQPDDAGRSRKERSRPRATAAPTGAMLCDKTSLPKGRKRIPVEASLPPMRLRRGETVPALLPHRLACLRGRVAGDHLRRPRGALRLFRPVTPLRTAGRVAAGAQIITSNADRIARRFAAIRCNIRAHDLHLRRQSGLTLAPRRCFTDQRKSSPAGDSK